MIKIAGPVRAHRDVTSELSENVPWIFLQEASTVVAAG